MLDWDKLKSFNVAAESGSLTGAAAKLGVSQSAVSRHISGLERDLGVDLFQRHARGLVMTHEGKALFRSTQDMAQAASLGLSDLQNHKNSAEGVLRVAAPSAFGVGWLIPRLARFQNAYPKLRIDVRLDDHFYDLLQLEADCAIRIKPAEQGDLIQKKLTVLATGLFASEAYIAKFGEPKTPGDLDRHQVIGFGNASGIFDQANWATRFGRHEGNPRIPRLEVNNVFGMLRAARSGVGIAALPIYVAGLSNHLVRVLPDHDGPNFSVYFVFPMALKHTKRLRVFKDFLADEFSDTMDETEHNSWVVEL